MGWVENIQPYKTRKFLIVLCIGIILILSLGVFIGFKINSSIHNSKNKKKDDGEKCIMNAGDNCLSKQADSSNDNTSNPRKLYNFVYDVNKLMGDAVKLPETWSSDYNQVINNANKDDIEMCVKTCVGTKTTEPIENVDSGQASLPGTISDEEMFGKLIADGKIVINHKLLNEKPKERETKNRSIGERICLDILEELFPSHKFATVRPNWLVNSFTDRNLELDLYNHELKLAIEFNGKQHYTYPNTFMKTEDDMKKQIYRDWLKKMICKAYGINLIVIKQKSVYNRKEIKQEIIEYLKQFNIKYNNKPPNYFSKPQKHHRVIHSSDDEEASITLVFKSNGRKKEKEDKSKDR